MATHLQGGLEAFPLLFPVMLGVLFWAGLRVRDARLRALLSFRG